MSTTPPLAFTSDSPRPGLEIRVNFGVFAGREATPAEIDELARRLVPEVGAASIVSEARHEVDAHAEASVHQVRIEIDGDRLPPSAEQREELARRLVDEAERWAEACIADRHAEVSEV